MICFNCGYEAGEYDACPACGIDLTVYKRIQVASALCYNEGLRKARVRDLSGAIDELIKALKYNKYNTDARNLLGLVYFEIGEPVNAMGEWVISKNLQPEDNLADRYLRELQGDPGMLNRMDSATKKYNQAVEYIRQEDYDLATIQLKRLVSKNPGMIRARSLLALLYLKNGEPKAARKELVAAGKIDVGNPTINTYFEEVKEVTQKNRNRSMQRRKDEEDITESTVRDNSSRFTYLMDYSKVSIVNIIIGALLGLLVAMFMIFPAIRQSANNDTMSALINANEDARSNQNDISAMEQTIEGLTNQLANYEGKADVKNSYENLLSAQIALGAGDLDSASKFYGNISRELLEGKGKEAFDSLSGSISGYNLSKNYNIAKTSFSEENYEGAITAYLSVIATEENFDGGNALFNLATCYEKTGDTENAVKYYSRVKEIYGERRLGKNADARLTELLRGRN